MRLIRGLLAVFLLAGFAVAGWCAALTWIPVHVTDEIWHGILKRGSVNTLFPPKTPHAGNDAVGLANPDMISRAAIYDLSKGPVVFDADVPTDLQYWSVTVFAHNSDTLFVANDRATGPGHFSFVVRTHEQRSNVPANAQVVSPSMRGFILVRAVMRDPHDKADVARTIASVGPERVTSVPDTAAR